MSGGALQADKRAQYRAGGALIDIQGAIARALELSRADACVVIGQQDAAVNIRWANNTITTSGVMDKASLSVVSIIGRRVASITRTYFPPDQIEAMVRESEAACRDRPEAPDYMPLLGVDDAVDGDLSRDAQATPWDASPAPASIHVLDTFVAQLGGLLSRVRAT